MTEPNYVLATTEYISGAEIADRAGISQASLRSQMAAMRRRKTNPVDLRVPAEEMPADAGTDATYYWRGEVEAWLDERAARAARRARAAAEREAEQA